MSKIERIVSLVPAITETLFFLGLGNYVKGVTEHCDFPEEAKNRDKVGTFGYPDIAKITNINPELILADKIVHKKAIEDLKFKGFNVLAYSPSNVKSILEFMKEIGSVCGIERTVNKSVKSLEKRLLKLRKIPEGQRPRVLRLMNTSPYIITPGITSFQYDALRWAGAKLMYFNLNDPYVKVNIDQIKEFDPEIILFCGVKKGEPLPPRCTGCVAEKPICQRTSDDIITKDWEQITAVKKERVYPISCNLICRPGPRLIEGIEKLNKLYF